jgi:hypothetical protein
MPDQQQTAAAVDLDAVEIIKRVSRALEIWSDIAPGGIVRKGKSLVALTDDGFDVLYVTPLISGERIPEDDVPRVMDAFWALVESSSDLLTLTREAAGLRAAIESAIDDIEAGKEFDALDNLRETLTEAP